MASDFFNFQQFTIRQSHAAMKVGTDSDLLGALCAGGRSILDIGTGTGVLSLMMAQRFPEAQITAIEIDDDAVIDAAYNFEQSCWKDRITLQHISLQDYLLTSPPPHYDAVVCNPPYFDRSLECPSQGRTRARHTSSLPFTTLINGAYTLLENDGLFSVCIPPEVLDEFTNLCLSAGFSIYATTCVKTLPSKPPKRFVLTLKKGITANPQPSTHCLRNQDRTRSPWYKELMQDFLICGDL
mgnify:CR=1 FL=1